MSTFDLIARVLAKLEEPLAERHGDKLTAKFTAKLAYLSAGYGRLHGAFSHRIDYGEPETRWCYLYKYVAPHADYLFKVLRRAKAAKGPLFRSTKVEVACLGGGPGTDVIALVRYLASQANNEPVEAVHFVVFDVEPGWEAPMNVLLGQVGGPIKFTAEFRVLDVADPSTWEDVAFREFDMVLSSFFVSEIKRIRFGLPGRAFWKAVLTAVKPGCVIAVNDNNDERITGYFDGIVGSSGAFETLIKDQEEVSCGDSFGPVQKYIDRFDHRPKRNGNTAFRVLRKVV